MIDTVKTAREAGDAAAAATAAAEAAATERAGFFTTLTTEVTGLGT